MSTVNARVDYDGVEQGADQLDRLVRGLGQAAAAQEDAAGSAQQLERKLRGEARAAREAEESTRRASATMAATSVSADTAGQKIGQVGGALGNLGGVLGRVSPQLGSIGGALGAVGSAATAATSAMGPFGLALAAVTTALTVGVGMLEEYRAEAQRATQEVDNLREALVALREEQDRQSAEAQTLSGLVTTADFRRAREDTERDIANLDREIARRQAVIERASETLRTSRGIASAELSRAFEAQQAAMRGVEDAENAIERVGLRTLQVEREVLAERQRSLDTVESLNRSFNETLGTIEQLAGGQSAFSRLGAGLDEFAEAARRLRQQSDRTRPRRRRGARRDRRSTAVSAEGKELLEAARVQEETAARVEAHEQRMLQYALERGEALKALDRKQAESAAKREEEERRIARVAAELREEMRREEERIADFRAGVAREVTRNIASSLQVVASAFVDAFGQAIEGQKTLEQASLEATKSLLKTIGEQMVAIGIRETLEGFANIVSNPPVAATKIPIGVALIASGVGLGAAGAAIPSQPTAPAERPRGDTDRGGEGGGTMIVIHNNQPTISAGTDAQLSRTMVRQIDRGRGFGTRRPAG